MAKQAKQSNPRNQWIFLFVIVAATLVVFSNSLKHEILFGWDDGEYILNESVQQVDVESFFSEFYLGMYQPLAVLSLSLNYQSAADDPAPYHATNLILHLINVLLVFFLFRRFSGRIDVAGIVALLFAIHPMHVEAVSWIATRSNQLYSLFYLSAVLMYLKYLDSKKITHLGLVFLLFVASCFSKSMAVTLPVLLFLFDFYKGRKIKGMAIWEKLPFLITSLIFGFVSISAAGDFGHIRNLDVEYNLIDRLVMIIYSLMFYLIKAIAPAQMSAVYAYPAKAGMWLPWEFYFSILIFAFVVFNIFKSGKMKKDVVFGSLFFLITISLTLPLVWSRVLMLADRYTYLPYLGLFFILAKGAVLIIESKQLRIRKMKQYLYPILGVYLLFLLVSAYQRNLVWKDAETMISDVIEKERSDVDVAIGYFFRGNIRDYSQNPQGALDDFSKAIELNPGYTMAYNNRGIIKGSMQDFEGALADFEEAVEQQPDYADAIYNRGNANYYLGNINDACGDWGKAAMLGSEQAAVVREKYCR